MPHELEWVSFQGCRIPPLAVANTGRVKLPLYSLTFDNCSPNSICNFLESVDRIESARDLQLTICGTIAPQTANCLLKLSTNGNVELIVGPAEQQFARLAAILAARDDRFGINVWQSGWFANANETAKTLSDPGRNRLFFAGHCMIADYAIPGLDRFQGDLTKLSKSNRWAYQLSADGSKILKLYIPFELTQFLVQAGQLADLEALSLDPAWIPTQLDRRGRLNSKMVNLTSLGALTNLRELYLPDSFVNLRSADFLLKLKNLEVLQIGCGMFDQSLAELRNCKKLRKVILLGVPDAALILQIGSLPKLEQLIVVYSNIEPGIDSIRAHLPNVDVTAIDIKVGIQPPGDFRRHLEQLRDEITAGQN